MQRQVASREGNGRLRLKRGLRMRPALMMMNRHSSSIGLSVYTVVLGASIGASVASIGHGMIWGTRSCLDA